MEVRDIVHVIGTQACPVNVQVHLICFMDVNAFDVVHVCAPSIRHFPYTRDYHEASASYIHYTTQNIRLQTRVLLPAFFLTYIEDVKRLQIGKVHAQAIHPLPVHSQEP